MIDGYLVESRQQERVNRVQCTEEGGSAGLQQSD